MLTQSRSPAGGQTAVAVLLRPQCFWGYRVSVTASSPGQLGPGDLFPCLGVPLNSSKGECSPKPELLRERTTSSSHWHRVSCLALRRNVVVAWDNVPLIALVLINPGRTTSGTQRYTEPEPGNQVWLALASVTPSLSSGSALPLRTARRQVTMAV